MDPSASSSNAPMEAVEHRVVLGEHVEIKLAVRLPQDRVGVQRLLANVCIATVRVTFVGKPCVQCVKGCCSGCGSERGHVMTRCEFKVP